VSIRAEESGRAGTALRATALALLVALACPGAAPAADAGGRKILVVMSYHQGNTWQDQTREGIDSVLGAEQLTYFYLDTKRNEAGGPERAREAFELYERLRPDAVIAADDHAQALFVVPYLRDKVPTPVVFLGVNNDAGKYGFPASNVTGVLEVKHISESLNFARLLLTDLRKVSVLYKDNLSNRYNVEQMRREQAGYPVEIVRYVGLQTLEQALAAVRSASAGVGAFFWLNLTGITDEAGAPVEDTDAVRRISEASPIPIIAADDYQIEAGALCGVIKTGFEQGELAARMVLEALGGTSPRDIPIVKNSNGKRYINVSTARRLGIPLEGEAIIGTRLVR